MKPRPPASETAAASAGIEGPPAKGAPTTGISMRDATPFAVIAGLGIRSWHSNSHSPPREVPARLAATDERTSASGQSRLEPVPPARRAGGLLRERGLGAKMRH